MRLTEREKWLMKEAYKVGYTSGHHDTVESQYNGECADEGAGLDEYLEDSAADGVTVEMALTKDAPSGPPDAAVRRLLEAVGPYEGEYTVRGKELSAAFYEVKRLMGEK